MTALTDLTALEIASRIKSGEFTSAEAVEAHIARIEAVNPALNAIVVKRYDEARREAKTADRLRASGETLPRLHGVPVTIKESLDIPGTPSTFGLPSRARIIADTDEVHVERLRRAGAIVLGKTNVAQMLVYLEADNPLYGRTNNPWNLERTCGGSSGGEGAIIAAGGSPLGLGNDLGGSVRVPAAFCGIAGIKPTAGRCDDESRYSVPLGQQAIVSQAGILARSVDDVAAGLAIIDGANRPGSGIERLRSDGRDIDIASLTIGFYVDDGTFTPAPANQRAVADAAAALRDAGASLCPWTPPDANHALDLMMGIVSAGGNAYNAVMRGNPRAAHIARPFMIGRLPHWFCLSVGALLGMLGQPGMGREIGRFGRRDVERYWQLLEALFDYRRAFARALDTSEAGPIDVLLAPAGGLPAVRHGATKELGLIGAYTALYNVLGLPAGVVPFTRVRSGEESNRRPGRDLFERAAQASELGSAGLPVGVQVVARTWQDHRVLGVMRVLESIARSRSDFPKTPVSDLPTGVRSAA